MGVKKKNQHCGWKFSTLFSCLPPAFIFSFLLFLFVFCLCCVIDSDNNEKKLRCHFDLKLRLGFWGDGWRGGGALGFWDGSQVVRFNWQTLPGHFPVINNLCDKALSIWPINLSLLSTATGCSFGVAPFPLGQLYGQWSGEWLGGTGGGVWQLHYCICMLNGWAWPCLAKRSAFVFRHLSNVSAHELLLLLAAAPQDDDGFFPTTRHFPRLCPHFPLLFARSYSMAIAVRQPT